MQRCTIRLGTALALLGASSACTTLGPMPATTAISAVAAERPDVELQVGAIPGYYLSSAVAKDPEGSSVLQAMLLFEPDDLIDAPGLVGGGRVIGSEDSGTYAELLLGYRRALDQIRRFSLGAFGYASRGSASRDDASYEATRAGAEGVFDIAVTPEEEPVSVHVFAGASLTGIWANGEYCMDAEGFGMDCGSSPPPRVKAEAVGFYPALSGGLALNLGRHAESVFHGLRLAIHGAGGTMPRVIGARQQNPESFGAGGVSLTLGLGAATKDR
jgi:hypothetical protein